MPIDVYMTQLSPTMTEGKIVRWLKKEGDELTSGEVLAEIETDKATMEMEVVDEGILHRILQQEGSMAPVGSPIAVIAEEDEEVPEDYMPEGVGETPSTDQKVEMKAFVAVAEPEQVIETLAAAHSTGSGSAASIPKPNSLP